MEDLHGIRVVRLRGLSFVSAAQEFDPLLLYCEEQGRAVFATWRLTQGQESLAIFFDHDAAERYRAAAGLDERWRTLQPDRPTLHRILRQCRRDGVLLAVLDPEGDQARRIFDIPRILEEVERKQDEQPL